MVKELLATFFFSSVPALGANIHNKVDYKAFAQTELNERNNYTLISVDGFTGDEFRIYHYDDLLIDEISDDAFLNTNFRTLVLTNSVKKIDKIAFENAPSILRLKYTGSESEFSDLELNYEFQDGISFYAVDEGFINYWNENVRPEKATNICDMTYDSFTKVYSLYKNLSNEDLETVDAYVDLAGATIEDSMKELIEIFTKTPASKQTEEWNQTGAITLITVIAVIGMTSITVFFLLKTKNIIS